MRILLEMKMTVIILTRNIFHLRDYVAVAMTTTTLKVMIFNLTSMRILNMMKSQLVQHMVLIQSIVMEAT